jgi:hypothetical protein
MTGDWREFDYEDLASCKPFTKHCWNGEINVDENEEL